MKTLLLLLISPISVPLPYISLFKEKRPRVGVVVWSFLGPLPSKVRLSLGPLSALRPLFARGLCLRFGSSVRKLDLRGPFSKALRGPFSKLGPPSKLDLRGPLSEVRPQSLLVPRPGTCKGR